MFFLSGALCISSSVFSKQVAGLVVWPSASCHENKGTRLKQSAQGRQFDRMLGRFNPAQSQSPRQKNILAMQNRCGHARLPFSAAVVSCNYNNSSCKIPSAKTKTHARLTVLKNYRQFMVSCNLGVLPWKHALTGTEHCVSLFSVKATTSIH